jgi:sirohydrochlorin cobaltochelatase
MMTIIVLAMHGAPPNDFPQREMAEMFGLHARLEHADGLERATLERRHVELDAKMRSWPRSAQNDPFYVGSQELAKHLNSTTGYDVIVGFNEFCAPSLDDAFDQAATRAIEKIIVITPMVTRGGEHAEVDILSAVRRAQDRYPRIPILYAWPFETSAVAQFLAAQIDRFA